MLDNGIETSRDQGRRQRCSADVTGGTLVDWQRITRSGVATALLLGGLAGCGGGDDNGGSDGNTPTNPPTGQLTAVDGFSVVRPGEATRIDLSSFVRGTGATLTTISSEQAGCSAARVSDLSAEITSESGLCEFSYKVSGQGVDASAKLNTLASTLASPVLPPLSQTMTLAEASKAFDLPTLLGADWPAGYELDPASLRVQGGSAQGTAIANGNVVTYTPPSTTEPVWNQILFVLKDPLKPGEDAMGALYITVSDSVNQPPVIGEPKYDYNAQGGAPVVTMKKVTLDLATLANLDITEPDGDDWQLIEVQSYSASVAPLDPYSVANKQFTFQAGSPGDHIVSYVVGDHEAGFSMGLIKMKVGADESPKTWNNIAIGPKTFQATPLYSEVTGRGVMAEAIYDEGVANSVAGVTLAAAQSYCSNGNHLATLEELELLRTTPAADAERSKYPVERTYITYDVDGQPWGYALNTGSKTPYNPTSPAQYVICVNEAQMGYTSFTTPYGKDTGLSDGALWSLGSLESAGGTKDPEVIFATNIGSTPLSAANVQLNPPGCPLGTCKVEIKGDATTYGQFTARVANAVNPANAVEIELTLLQDARVSAAVLGTDNSPADGVTANTVRLKITDKDDNPLYNTKVKLKYSASSSNVTISPASCNDALSCTPVTTDDNGNLTLKLTTKTPGNYKITFPNDALTGGLPTASGVAGCNATGEIDKGVTLDGVGTFSNYCQTLNWTEANNYCSSLGKGYRLPTSDEFSAFYKAYPNNQWSSVWLWEGGFYWTSTPGMTDTHYGIYSNDGRLVTGYDNTGGHVTCVR